MNKKSNLQTLTSLDIEQSKDSLPLTHHIATQNKDALKDIVVLHINHALSDVYAINEFLVDELGAKVFFITTPYNNTYYLSYKYDYFFIRREGENYTKFFNGKKIKTLKENTDFIENMHHAILFAIDYILKKYKKNKIIVLQDGGYSAAESILFETADPFQNLANLLGMVEQTQGGTKLFYEKNKSTLLNYPVLTISRSLIKARVESHFIAQRIIEEINRTIYKMGYFLNFKTVLLGGYGIIGRQLARYLRGLKANVVVLEKNKFIKRLAEKEGFKTIENITTDVIDKSFCLIGVTGQCIFGIKEFLEFLESKNKYYFLASGSSKRNEFSELIDFFENHKNSTKKYYNTHPALKKIQNQSTSRTDNGVLEYICTINGITKTLYLLGEGFPINLYDNEIQSIPDRAIDPIQALLLLCVIKLRKLFPKLENGVHNVSEANIRKVLKINEEAMLTDWFYLNDISAYHRKPFRFFKPHPLEKLLTEMQ